MFINSLQVVREQMFALKINRFAICFVNCSPARTHLEISWEKIEE